MNYKNKYYRFAVYLVLLLALLAGGYYLGGTYGFSPFETAQQQQKKIVETEKTLADGRTQGLISLVGGRILEMSEDGASMKLADKALGVIYKAPSGVVERTILIDKSTLIVREEVSGGPHFIITADRLRPGYFVSVYLTRNDLKVDKATAKEIVVNEFVPVAELSTGKAQ